MAALSAPRSDPANNQAVLPRANPAQAPFGRVVGQKYATIVDESGEAVPALQHIINRLENVGRARELVALLTQPGFQLDEQRQASFSAHEQSLRIHPAGTAW